MQTASIQISRGSSLSSLSLLIVFGPEYQHYRLKIVIWIVAGLGAVILRIRRLDVARVQRRAQKHVRTVEESSA